MDITDLSLSCRPIGFVRTATADADIARQRRTLRSTVVIRSEYADGLVGIEDYSHLIVLFWLHRAAPPRDLIVHPRGDPGLPACGIFAARGRNHPNSLGLAVVELFARRGVELEVGRLDAFDGTPVIDLKPYDDYDRVDAPRVPAWWRARARTGSRAATPGKS